LATAAYASEMGPTYFEVMFSKSSPPHSEYWRVCIELDDDVVRQGGPEALPGFIQSGW
jgi:hypothetical protein